MATVISMRGRKVDMAKLAARHAHKRAIGNAGLNARGDKIDTQGMVLKTREQITSEYNTEYNTSNPKAVKQVGLSGIQSEIMSPKEALGQLRKQMGEKQEKSSSKRKIVDSET